MRRLLGVLLLGLVIAAIPSLASAQAPAVVRYYSGTYSVYGAPGNYGMSWGVPSYGVPRTYSDFSSPYGAGFAYGYAPTGVMPGPFGVGLWRPGFATPGYVYGAANSYRTFPVRTWPVPSGYGPPVGAYAPGFGPTPIPMW
ncbi:MAG: hypothetical protein JWN86_4278 [Planctomycetota bacterium]|nr:hypothetical protein [Planctomycetota bacterium]